MSMAFPIILSPVKDSDQCYVDGGVLNNFPLNDCLEKNCDSDEILGFDIRFPEQENKILEESTIINYLVIIHYPLSLIHYLYTFLIYLLTVQLKLAPFCHIYQGYLSRRAFYLLINCKTYLPLFFCGFFPSQK